MDLFGKAQVAVEYVRHRAAVAPRVGIILGSGLGGFAAQVKDAVVIPYAEIPHFPQSTVEIAAWLFTIFDPPFAVFFIFIIPLFYL